MVDEEVHWGMPWLIPPLRGRALLFRPGAEVEILWKLREVVSRRMEIGSSFRRFISTIDYSWISWWGHYPLLVFMTQQHYMALVLLGSELNAAHSCMLFSNQKMGAKMEAETRITEVWFYTDPVCTSLYRYVCSFHLNKCLQLRVVMLLSLCLKSCSDWNGFFRWEFIKSQAIQRFWPQDKQSRFQSKQHPQHQLNILNPQLPGETSSRSMCFFGLSSKSN